MSILCKMGIHKPSKTKYITVTKYRRRSNRHGNKYHRNYQMCERCGKTLDTFAFKEKKNDSK